ncbi:MmcQ/YjbR family DNA-binding protein [Salmonella enterica]|nr:MmcQ/YjbR family DNA-binding protein [Salmonella enterica subsp. enterica serovar Infantis]EBY8444396.1 MmcQ/YjbR family DNA-binding protein [Salmonella enterica subsp. enterica serovar Infantis]ECK3599848.1 MmcQ/YjbR family DNA-binding protein [Salmonella enterica]EDD0905644.1 MmcQ/YjbR family DNA-binding protein [Salmonella enterica subsp. enterica serovar Infantis]EDT2379834.1 MmcQ/YjbR family DNA-binding protein [Salmonella enterica]
MARPKSEDKKQALLEAATQAIAQSGIAASTAVIARNAGVAEGTLFRYFATKDELINTLYLHLKQDLCQSMIMELDRSITDAKMMTRFIWNSYISWGLNHPARHRAIRQLAVSEKLTKETEQRADDMFPELRDLCHRSVLMVFMSDEYRAFGDGLFLALAETTMDFAARDPARAGEYIALGFEAMWRALTRAIMDGQTLHAWAKRCALELPFTEHCWPFGPQYDVFKVGGKIFMLFTEHHCRPVVNLKSDPQKSLVNQQIYPSIAPGYHMNKKHWISVYAGEDITVSLLNDLINDSWNLVVDGLPKREQLRLRPR